MARKIITGVLFVWLCGVIMATFFLPGKVCGIRTEGYASWIIGVSSSIIFLTGYVVGLIDSFDVGRKEDR